MQAIRYAPRLGTVRIPMPGGDWIEVKLDLCAGDLSAGARALNTGDYQGYRIARIAAWLVDWSLRDQAGVPLPLGDTEAAKIAAVAALSVRGFNAVWSAIDAHDRDTEAEVADQGDPSSPAGAPPSPPVSGGTPSPSGGDSSEPS